MSVDKIDKLGDKLDMVVVNQARSEEKMATILSILQEEKSLSAETRLRLTDVEKDIRETRGFVRAIGWGLSAAVVIWEAAKHFIIK